MAASNGLMIKSGEKVLFIGDSITDCGRTGPCMPVAGVPLGSGYVKMAVDLIRARYPERSIEFVNKGIGGNTIKDLRDRWEDDVVFHRPDWLMIAIGINDLSRMLEGNARGVSPLDFEKFYREILDITKKKISAKVVLMDPFYLSLDADQGSLRGKVLSVLPEYLNVVKKMAHEFQTLHLETHKKFYELMKYRSAGDFCPEPVHPYESGHMVIALKLLELLGW